MAKLSKANGEVIEVTPKNGKKFVLSELKEFIGGGWIEIVNLLNGKSIVCDEEGKLKRMPVNYHATDIFRKALGTADYIVGDVLIINDWEVD